MSYHCPRMSSPWTMYGSCSNVALPMKRSIVLNHHPEPWPFCFRKRQLSVQPRFSLNTCGVAAGSPTSWHFAKVQCWPCRHGRHETYLWGPSSVKRHWRIWLQTFSDLLQLPARRSGQRRYCRYQPSQCPSGSSGQLPGLVSYAQDSWPPRDGSISPWPSIHHTHHNEKKMSFDQN